MLVKRRISIKNKVIQLNIVGMFMENRKMYIFLSIVMSNFTTFNIFSQEALFIREANIMLTLADGYVLTANMFSKNMYILPIFLLLLNASLKNDTQIQFVIRNRTRADIWKGDCLKIVVLAAYISLLETLIILMIGTIRWQKLINWTDESSFFWMQTGFSLTKEESIFCVILTFVATTMITCILIGMAYLFIKEIMKSTIIAYGMCLGWGIIEHYSTKKMILNRLCMQFEYWIHKDYMWAIYSMICISILAFLSRELVKRRQYYERDSRI